MKTKVERLSALATIARHEKVFGITPDIIETKSREASVNPRKREILVLHRGDADRLQRMLNALEPGTYVRPHRHVHPPTAEAIVLLSGSIGFVPFLEDGTPDTDSFVLLHPTQGSLVLDCREGVWHTFFALEPNTVVFETKPGPYNSATDKEFATWAPAEYTPEAAVYLAKLEQEFRSKKLS